MVFSRGVDLVMGGRSPHVSGSLRSKAGAIEGVLGAVWTHQEEKYNSQKRNVS
jgi:hypothetical protein